MFSFLPNVFSSSSSEDSVPSSSTTSVVDSVSTPVVESVPTPVVEPELVVSFSNPTFKTFFSTPTPVVEWTSAVESVPTPVESVPTPVESVPTPVESVPTPVETKSTPVEVTPQNFRPVLRASSHLEFVSASSVISALERVLVTLTALLVLSPHPDVQSWVSTQIRDLRNKLVNAKSEAHATNAKRLAERVIHKFQKWGPVRFGSTEVCRNDFYDGSKRVDSVGNPITFDPVFVDYVRQLAKQAGLDAMVVLDNLHVGNASGVRFADFIQVKVIKRCGGCGGFHDDSSYNQPSDVEEQSEEEQSDVDSDDE